MNIKVSAQEKYELINSGILLEQGAKLSDDGKYKEAIELYNKIPRSDTNYSVVLHELSYSSYLDSSFESSVNYAKEGMGLFPEKATDWYSLIANSLDAMEKRKEALTYYDSTLKLNPNNYLTWFNKGISFYNLERFEDAKACFQKAILIYPYHPSSHFFLGAICASQGKVAEAMLSFTTSLLINPDNRYKGRAVSYLTNIA
ncbi:MAG TPA: tetratricopeptide repeat protein, partial [Chitinophagaceae bacterium]|nr:tetratricopeptide repeat protein [Chitinophagaceae bacterium]